MNSASFIVVLHAILIPLFVVTPSLAVKVEDCAIRAEEQLRHYFLMRKPLDARLALRQIIDLR